MTTITLITVLVFLNVPWVENAYTVDAHTRAHAIVQTRLSHRIAKRASANYNTSSYEMFRLTEGESWRLQRESTTVQGTKLEKLQEYFNDIPVFDAVVTVETGQDGELVDMVGSFVHGIGEDLQKRKELSEEECLNIALQKEADYTSRDSIGNLRVSYIIYVEANMASLACSIEYLIESNLPTRRPSYIIDAHTGGIIKMWNGLATFGCSSERYKSYGGNMKMGKVKYGEKPYCLDMRIENGICHLENQYVRVVDMNNTRNASIQKTASFPCKNGYDDEVNGAYSPVVDAFFYGTLVGKMFQDWFHTSAYGKQIVLRVHYRKNYVGAFWNGENCTFGDGNADEGYFPFTVMDMVAHEIAHGLTEFASGLLYFNESGGINEAFSDIVGEATEEYFRSADFVVGSDCKIGDYPVREFHYPRNDNVSFAHISEMRRSTDPHRSSGILRRAFYVIVKQKGFDFRNTVEVFLHANRIYWHHMSTFSSAACDVMKSAYDLGFSLTPFVRGFNDVGIVPCNISGHIRGLVNNRTYSNIIVTPNSKPLFSFKAPVFSSEIFISASSDSGDVQITVSNGTFTVNEYISNTIVAKSYSAVTLRNSAEDQLYIELSTDGIAVLNNVSLVAGYLCMDTFSRDNNQYYTAYIVACKRNNI